MIGTYFYIIYFCCFVMFLVCVLPDVCNIFASTAGAFYIIFDVAGNIIVYSTTIIFSTGSIVIHILVGDIFSNEENIFVLLYRN